MKICNLGSTGLNSMVVYMDWYVQQMAFILLEVVDVIQNVWGVEPKKI